MNNYQTINPITHTSGFTTGGTPSMLQRVSGFMNWQTMAIIVGVLLLILFSYYTYKQYADTKTLFNANRENIPKDIQVPNVLDPFIEA